MVEEVYKARRISSEDLAVLGSKSKGKGLPKNNGSGISSLGGRLRRKECFFLKDLFFFILLFYFSPCRGG